MTSTRLPVGGGFARFVLVATTAVISALTFAFSFRNVWVLGDFLAVDPWIAPLVGPAVDLSVIGLLVTVQWLSLAGATRDELRPGRRLLYTCGLVTLLLNSLPSAITGWTTGDSKAWGRAVFEAIAPWLLIAWSHVGPWLLRLFLTVRQRAEDLVDQKRDQTDQTNQTADQASNMVAHGRVLVDQESDLVTAVRPQAAQTLGDLDQPPIGAGSDSTSSDDQTPELHEPDAQTDDQDDIRPRPDPDLVDQFGDQLRDLHAAGKLNRYRVEQLTGANKNQAMRLIDLITNQVDQTDQTTDQTDQTTDQTDQRPDLVTTG